MSNFKNIAAAMQSHFDCMVQGANNLYVTDVTGDELWNAYLNAFPVGTNRVMRVRREFDCSACRHFIKQFGNVVTIKNGVLDSIWDFDSEDPNLKIVAAAMAELVKSKPVCNIYVVRDCTIGTAVNRKVDKETGGVEWYAHWALRVPARLQNRSTKTVAEIKGEYHDDAMVFLRSLNEITMDAIDSIMELIDSNNLYRGFEWKTSLTQLKRCKTDFDKLMTENEKVIYAWETAPVVGKSVSRIRNHSFGTLLTDVSSGRDLNSAVTAFEQMVAPTNYKRPKAVFTTKMLEDAKKKLEEMGYIPALSRRFACPNDMSVNNILFINRDDAKNVQGSDIFGEMAVDARRDARNFERAQEISIEDFVAKVLPTAKSVEAYVENRHAGNFVSLIAPRDHTAPSMFKWNNAFSWAYSGNVTDSMKENVKKAGGNVNGVLRFSIQWNDDDSMWANSDLDAHCYEPDGNHIYFGHGYNRFSGGSLDVDIQYPERKSVAVENITWPSTDRMVKGKYVFRTKCYSYHNGNNGFKAEIEFEGKIHHFQYTSPLQDNKVVDVATVNWDGHHFTITPANGMAMTSEMDHGKIWDIPTNDFAPVSMMMFSPNYWDEQKGIGNKHYFFMLRGCVNNQEPNGFYNEFLKPELDKYKHVMEAIGSKVHVSADDDQLSGIGFSSTKKDSLIVRVTGATKRVMKINF